MLDNTVIFDTMYEIVSGFFKFFNGRVIMVRLLNCKITLLGLVLFLSAGAFSYWSEPIFHPELNSFDPPSSASSQCISSDSMSIFYSREIDPGVFASRRIFEARRNVPDGPFIQSRQLMELNNNEYTSDPWISKDGLRLYYVQIQYSNDLDRPVRFLKMATRNDYDSDWELYHVYSELSMPPLGNVCSQISLTADELTILWYSKDSEGLVSPKIMTASRPSMLHGFSDFSEVAELSDLSLIKPFISPDGLSVYFSIPDTGGQSLWMGSRPDMDSPFGNFEPLDEINQYGIATAHPCISWDGQSLYYFQRQGEPGDPESSGVFVSHWLEHPFDAAVKNLNEAIGMKTRAAEMVDIAMEKETHALDILTSLGPEQIPQHLTAKQLREVRIQIQNALQRQVIARDNLYRSLMYLNNAMIGLLPPVVPAAPPGS